MANKKDPKLAAKERRLAQEARSKEIRDNEFLLDLASGIGTKAAETLEFHKEINALKDDQLTKMVKQKENQDQQLKDLAEYEDKLGVLMDKRSKEYKREVEAIKKNKLRIQQEKERVDLADDLKKKSDGLLDGLEGQIKKIPLIGGLLAKAVDFDELKEKMGGVLSGITKDFIKLKKPGVSTASAIGGSFKAAIPGIVSFGAALWTALLPILPILLAIVAAMAIFYTMGKALIAIDNEAIDLSRNLGIGKDNAREMASEMRSMVSFSDNAAISTESLVEAQKELAKYTGMSATFTERMLESQVLLTKYYDMTQEEAAKLNVYAESIGSNVEDLKVEAQQVLTHFNKTTGASITLRDVLKDVGSLSEEIKVQFRGSVKEMTHAVALAKAMGTNLEASQSAAEKTLSIEESLKNEMTLMAATGLQINNNAIRQARVMGEPGKVLELQKKQMLEIGDVSKRLPYEQELIAKAMGMTHSQLLKMNRTTLLNKRLKVDIADATWQELEATGLMDEAAAKALVTQNEKEKIQERMAAATERINMMWLSVAEMVISVVDSVSWFFGQDPVEQLTEEQKKSGMVQEEAPSAGATALAAGGTGAALGAAIGSIIPGAGTLIGGLLGGAIGTTIGGIRGLVGDVISPAKGKTQISPKEGGLYTLSPNDDFMAAPGIFDRSGGGKGIDLSGLINEIKGLRRDIQTQPIQVTVDGRVVSAISKVQAQQNSVRTTGYGR
jgi:hypothetical protein